MAVFTFFNYPTLFVNHRDIADLPPIIFPRVLSYLSSTEQCLIRRVSQVWHRTSQSKEALFELIQSIAICDIDEIIQLKNDGFQFPVIQKKFHFKRDETLNDYLNNTLGAMLNTSRQEAVHFFRSLSPSIKEVIQFLDFSGTCIQDQDLSAIVPECPNLEYLNLERTLITGAGLTQICDKIKILKLAYCNHIKTEHFKQIFSRSTNIESLSLTFFNNNALVLQDLDLSNLRTLYLAGNINEQVLRRLLSTTTELESLFLNFMNITGEAFEDFSPSKLITLHLSVLNNLEEEALQKLLNRSIALKNLTLEHSNVTGKVFQDFNSSQLKQLSLFACNQLDEHALQKLLSKPVDLHHLHIEDMNITERALQGLKPSNLITLFLDTLNVKDDGALQNLLGEASALEELTLFSEMATEKVFYKFTSSQLEVLSLNCPKFNFSDPVMKSIFNKNPELNSLMIQEIDVTTTTFQHCRLPNLVGLDLSTCRLGKNVLPALFAQFPKLESLALSATNITASDFENLMVRNLKSLDLSDLDSGLDPESLREFFRRNKSLKRVCGEDEIVDVFIKVRSE